MYVVNLILNKYLNGMAENRTRRSLNYMLGLDIPKQTNNTIVNNMLTKVRKLFEPTYRSHILKDPYLAVDMYKIFEKDPTLHITRLSCLVHIRRYFIKSMKFEDETGIARRFLERIRIIYKFEKSFKNLSDEERQKERATNVIPILNDMYNDLLYPLLWK